MVPVRGNAESLTTSVGLDSFIWIGILLAATKRFLHDTLPSITMRNSRDLGLACLRTLPLIGGPGRSATGS
jgi:hypothetical protein